jgi:hypothetical protein
VTVIAPTALEADGWDTGLMVLGPEKAQQVVREQGLAVYMIVKEGDGFKTWMSPQFRTFLVGEKIKKQDCGFFCGLWQTEDTLTAGARDETDSCRYR